MLNDIAGEGLMEIVGSHGLRERNEKGEILVKFYPCNKLWILNIGFQNHPRRKYKWKSPADKAKYQTDYILVRKRYKNLVKDSNSYLGVDAPNNM